MIIIIILFLNNFFISVMVNCVTVKYVTVSVVSEESVEFVVSAVLVVFEVSVVFVVSVVFEVI